MSNGGIEGPAGMAMVNAEVKELAGAGDRRPSVVDDLRRTDLAIRDLLSAVLPDLPDEFLDSASRFEASDSGRRVIAELRGLVADGVEAGRAPVMKLYTASGSEYSVRDVGGEIHVLAPAEFVCASDPPAPAP